MTSTGYEVRGGVAVITLDNPPVNGLGHALRSALVAGVDRANADGAVGAIVVAGAGKTFSAGADIREFNTPKSTAEPTLRRSSALLRASGKPVVAAIGGACMGGGLELALGCHYRVAAAAAPDRVAGSQAGPHARRWRHATAASGGRRRDCVEHDRDRGERARRAIEGHGAVRCGRRRRCRWRSP